MLSSPLSFPSDFPNLRVVHFGKSTCSPGATVFQVFPEKHPVLFSAPEGNTHTHTHSHTQNLIFSPEKIDVSPRNRANFLGVSMGKEKFFRSFKPIEGAVEALKEMQAHPALEVWVIGALEVGCQMFKEKPDRNVGGDFCVFFLRTDRNS